MKKHTFYMPRLRGEKIILLVVFFVVILFFSTDFGLIDIQKTAIILAAGIDRTEDGLFSVTAQIAVPEASKSGGAAQAIAVSGSGETVARAFQEINTKTGWFPKLIFCDLIVLGETVTKNNVFDCLGYFLRNEQMSDNCLLAACEGSARDALSASSPTEDMTALALQKILATEAKESGNISTVNLKDFAIGYFSPHKSGYMPFLYLLSPEEGGAKSEENAQSGAGGQSAAGKGKAERGKALSAAAQGGKDPSSAPQKEEKIFYGACTAVFYDGKLRAVLGQEESFALNLAVGKVRQATLQVPLPDGTVYALTLTNVRAKTTAREENGLPRLQVRLKAVARISDCTTPKDIENIAATNTVRQRLRRGAETILSDALATAFETCRRENCDIFGVADRMRKYHTAFYNACKDTLLQRTAATFEVSVKDSH